MKLLNGKILWPLVEEVHDADIKTASSSRLQLDSEVTEKLLQFFTWIISQILNRRSQAMQSGRLSTQPSQKPGLLN